MINRRDFLQLSARALGTLAFGNSLFAKNTFPLGVQLYTVR